MWLGLCRVMYLYPAETRPEVDDTWFPLPPTILIFVSHPTQPATNPEIKPSC